MTGRPSLTADDLSAATVSRALRQLARSHPNDLGWRLLAAHRASPRGTLSWRALATRVGWSSPEPVKLHYGRFARQLARELGLSAPPAGFWMHVIADWGPTKDIRGHTTFRLRSRVVQALRDINTKERARVEPGQRVHLLQAGISNGDKAWLDSSSKGATKSGYTPWVAPQSAAPGDFAVIYIRGIGFYAVGTVSTWPRPRRDWDRRYGAHLDHIRRIEPPIPLQAIQRRLPTLRWANYPRSIHTLSPEHARLVLALIDARERTKLPDRLDAEDLSLEELRATALAAAQRSLPAVLRRQTYRQRSEFIRRYVLMRAAGVCEGCGEPAPFNRPDGSPYLEPHHLKRVADEGPDHPAHVAAVCPTCHARVHRGADGRQFNKSIAAAVARAERA